MRKLLLKCLLLMAISMTLLSFCSCVKTEAHETTETVMATEMEVVDSFEIELESNQGTGGL